MVPEISQASHDAYMESLQMAGQMIMENGGETFRAEETVCRMGQGFGLGQVESFAVPSGLFISYRTPDDRLQTSVKRVHRHSTHLARVDGVNQVSRLVSSHSLDAASALERLNQIARMKGPMAGAWSLLSAAVCAGGFSLLFGGLWLEVLFSAAVALTVQLLDLILQRLRMTGIISNILGGFLTAFLPSLLVRVIPGLLTEAVVAGALMPLVPGLAMTNAVQDTLRGDMVSGLSHGVSALLTACLIAGGALLSPALLRLIFGGAF